MKDDSVYLPCVYIIKNTQSGKCYIGYTTHFHLRKIDHINLLKNKKHYCKALQLDYNKLNWEFFEIYIAKKFDSERTARAFEKKAIKRHLKSVYNSNI